MALLPQAQTVFREIAFELGVKKSRVSVYMERLGVTRPWRHEEILRRLHVKQALLADEIAARDEMDCSSTTVRKYLAEYGLIDANPDTISYGRLDALGSDSASPPA
ncbi:hypothetical protein [Halosimplex halobium]|uniref:hypothetical protein n=1 Tax=Halosimplex halobium TaxID=3396618 RepID=UPI003F56B13E